MASLRKTPWNIWLLAARPKTLPAAVVPVLLGTAVAVHEGGFRLVPALICLVFALLIQIGTNYANDYFDYRQGADTDKRVGPVRAVASGLVAPQTMWRATMIVLGAAFLIGLSLVFYGGWWLVAVGVLSILCAIAYTGGPYPLGYNGLGDIFVFIFFGLVAVMFTAYVQTGEFSWAAFWAGTGCGLLSVNLLVVNNARDIETDREAGKRTLPVRFGYRYAVIQYVASALVAYAMPDLLMRTGYSGWVLLPLLTLPFAAFLCVAMTRAHRPRDFHWLLARTAQLLLFYGLLMTLGILLG
ncbi:1,4-dihydroxy-2-naphthoate polyprenyltransferase [Ruficoccus amylovorans]|uniref:1,4-dihydroxy-2-naphthoate polyprenyltransferase n=1 Tax=Ruficoccus amylovorans TaxID=1804625 RepID=UPI0031B58D98